MTPKLILFDVDGTLVDSQNHILAAMTHAFERHGMTPPSRAATLSIVGLSLPQANAQLAPDLNDQQNAEVVAAYKRSFVENRTGGRDHSPLYPHVRDVLETLKAVPDYVLGVATGKSRQGLDIVLRTHELTGFFMTEQVSDHHPSKPHPAMVQAALSETGIEPGHAVMIGDTSFDMDMGRAAGAHTVGVSWGYHPLETLQKASPARIIDDIRHLPAQLSELWS